MMIFAICLVLLGTAFALMPLFTPAANRALGLGVESREPVERWQKEKNRLTGQLRDNDMALAEGRIDETTHDRNNRRLAAEADATLIALRRARDAFQAGSVAQTHLPGRITSALTALCVFVAAFAVSGVASLSDVDFTTSPHADGRIPLDQDDATVAAAGASGAPMMPLNADGAPDVEAMVARLEARVWDGAASPEDFRMLLRSYGVLGREADAPDVLKAAADQYPGDLEFRMGYLRMVVEAPDAPPAEELLAEVNGVLEQVPDMAEARWYRGLLNLRLGHPDAARRDLEWLVVRLKPDQPAAQKVRTLLSELGTAGLTQGEKQ